MSIVALQERKTTQKKSLILEVPTLSAQEAYALELAELRRLPNLDGYRRCLEEALLDGVDSRVDADMFDQIPCESLDVMDEPEGYDPLDAELAELEEIENFGRGVHPRGIDWDEYEMPALALDDEESYWELVDEGDDEFEPDPVAGKVIPGGRVHDLTSTMVA